MVRLKLHVANNLHHEQGVSIPNGSIKISIKREALLVAIRFQFQMVRLKSLKLRYVPPLTSVSIPNGSIKIRWASYSLTAHTRVSIPNGSIKILWSSNQITANLAVSIPNGSIKIKMSASMQVAGKEFQFQMVRLKLQIAPPLRRHSDVSIPNGSIKIQ